MNQPSNTSGREYLDASGRVIGDVYDGPVSLIKRESTGKYNGFIAVAPASADAPEGTPVYTFENVRACFKRALALAKEHKTYVQAYSVGKATDAGFVYKFTPNGEPTDKATLTKTLAAVENGELQVALYNDTFAKKKGNRVPGFAFLPTGEMASRSKVAKPKQYMA